MQTSRKGRLFFQLIIIVIIVGAISSAGYFYSKYQRLKSDPNLLSKEEVNVITSSIKKFMDLPDEEPTLATVSDKTKLLDQDFFKRSENGDKILIYPKAKKAILYRPSKNRIIEFAPLNIGTAPAEIKSSNNTTVVPIAIYNGSSVVGLTNEIEKKLDSIQKITISTKETASNRAYSKTLVIDLDGTHTELAKNLAEKLNGQVSTLPEGEKNPGTGILIIGAAQK